MSTGSAASISAIRCKSCVHAGASPTGPNEPIAALHSPPTSAKASRNRLVKGREARGLERHRARGSAKILDESGRLGLGRRGQRDGIDDGQMTIGGEYVHYAHAFVDQGVGLVDDAESSL